MRIYESISQIYTYIHFVKGVIQIYKYHIMEEIADAILLKALFDRDLQ